MQNNTTIAEALAYARERVDAIDARVLLQHALGVERAHLATHAHEALSAAQQTAYAALLHRRAAGEPVAYLTGVREFYGLEFHVTPDVLIPRPETELVVDIALSKLAQRAQPRALDLGAGSGAIAIAIAATRSDARLLATDVSPAALAIARGNAQRLLGADAQRVSFRQSDWFAAIVERDFDVIAANPPYIAAGDVHLTQGDLRFEPTQALIGGVDGFAALRTIIAGAAARLQPGGWLVLEHGYDQAERCRAMLVEGGYSHVDSAADLAGISRVSFAQRA